MQSANDKYIRHHQGGAMKTRVFLLNQKGDLPQKFTIEFDAVFHD